MKRMINIFFELNSGLPREKPSDNASIKRTHLLLDCLLEEPCILDVGFGLGMQTVTLAKLSSEKNPCIGQPSAVSGIVEEKGRERKYS